MNVLSNYQAIQELMNREEASEISQSLSGHWSIKISQNIRHSMAVGLHQLIPVD